MSEDIVMLDPERARALAATLRTGGESWRGWARSTTRLGIAADLADEVRPAQAALDELADDCELAAVDLELRADLTDAIGRGDWARVATLSRDLAGATAAWEGAIPGGLDEGEIAVTVTTGDDLLARMVPGPVTYVGAGGVGCEASSYITTGRMVGPDGHTYDLSRPNVVDREGGGARLVNTDWGPAPAGVDAWSLDGSDPGWVTVSVERGVGQVDVDPGWLAVFLAGPSGAGVLELDGTVSASLAAHSALRFDEYGAPVVTVTPPGATVVGSLTTVDEVGAVTPVLVAGSQGRPRYQTVTTARGATAAGVADLAVGAASAVIAADRAADEGNFTFVVQYQQHPDGRRRAIPSVYHLAADREGEPVVYAGYAAFDAEGDLTAAPIVPRLHGDYQPPVAINPSAEP